MSNSLQSRTKMRSLLMIAVAGILLAGCGDDAKTGKTIELKTSKDKLSYAVGADHARQLLEDPGFGNYDKQQILDGFAVGIKDEAAFVVACQQTIQSMMGPNGQQFNAAYKA